jgi:GT2 family glycosyltransferase
MAELTVSVCVPVHRVHAAPNLRTLQTGLAEALGGLSAELVVALNGVSATELELDANTRTVDLRVNRGVAPGWNAAARLARGEVLVFANDDVLLGPQSLALLHRALMEHPEGGVIGPLGTHWNVATATHLSWIDLADRPAGDLEECEVVSGHLFAVRREVYEQLGGFDERYAPCSYEEVDFCTAARVRLGLRCYAVAGVAVTHEWGISRRALPWKRVHFDGRSETLRSIHRRNRRHFIAKWGDPIIGA